MNAVAVTVTALVGATVLVLAEAVRRRDGAAVVNAAASLGVALVAVAGAVGFRVESGWFVPELALWAALAGLLHSVGMLGPYESVWWWDHVTHTVSAALLAALVYAGVVVTVGETWSPLAVAAATVGYTAVAGVVWELAELGARAVGERYDVDPVLVHYGWADSVLDVAFDVVGAVAVVALDVRWFVPLVEDAPATIRVVLLGTAGAFLAVVAFAAAGSLVRRTQSN